MTARCILIIPDAGPINSLWVASELPLLLKVGMPVIIVDQVYAEFTSDPEHYVKDREVKEFVEAHPEVFTIEDTNVGRMAAALRLQGTFQTDQSLGEAAIADFFQHRLQKRSRRPGRSVAVRRRGFPLRESDPEAAKRAPPQHGLMASGPAGHGHRLLCRRYHSGDDASDRPDKATKEIHRSSRRHRRSGRDRQQLAAVSSE
jgi:hypothetical protein